MTSTVTGSLTDVLGGLGPVTGSFGPAKFQPPNRQTTHGVLIPTLTDLAGTVQNTVTMPVVLPATHQANAVTGMSAQITCDVLNRVLGPAVVAPDQLLDQIVRSSALGRPAFVRALRPRKSRQEGLGDGEEVGRLFDHRPVAATSDDVHAYVGQQVHEG